MLRYNASPEQPSAGSHRAHWAHFGVLSVHTVCCGAPILLLLVAGALSGLSGVSAAAHFSSVAHAFMHAHETWILALSALLVALGGYAEWRQWQAGRRRFPTLFAISVGCFLANAALIAMHSGAPHVG